MRACGLMRGVLERRIGRLAQLSQQAAADPASAEVVGARR